jgi:predicted RNase H-like HicB family nuclease
MLGGKYGLKMLSCRKAMGWYFRAMKLKAIIHVAEEGGYWAEVPALPGCVTQGETRAELEENLREAIEAWLAAGQEGFVVTVEQQVLEAAV